VVSAVAGTQRRGWGVALGTCMLLAALNLVAGIAGGLARLGVPGPHGPALAFHGVLMVSGFFGCLIALERAVAVRHPLALLAPLLAGAAGLVAWTGAPIEIALWLWLFAGLALLSLYAWAGMRRAWSMPMAVQMLGAACWCIGIVEWLQGGVAHEALPAWMGFLVLTIAGERRELMQLVRLSTVARRWFAGAVALLMAAVVLAAVDGVYALQQPGGLDLAMQVWWVGCALLAIWLLAHDFAPRQWRAPQWRGMSAQALSLGYGWLLLAALLGLAARWSPLLAAGPAWHALLLGFVFSMVFGHAPLMLPALAGVHPVYSSALRVPAWLLGASLILRIVAAGFQHPLALALAGLGHAVAIALFALLMLRAAAKAR
jgi:hypothetical protein